MPTLRSVLENLPLADLKGLAEAAGVQVADKRKGSALADAVESLDPAHLRVLLNDLPRAALKQACRALGLDDSGREKALLVDRLIPLDDAAKRTTPSVAVAASPTPGKLTQADLERHLWSAADILRGSIDSSDYKSFIFGPAAPRVALGVCARTGGQP